MEEQKLKQKQKIEEFQRSAEEQRLQNEERQKATRQITDEYSDEAYQEGLGATAEEWKTIRPRFERTKQLANTPALRISVYGFGGGGSYSSSSSAQSAGTAGGTSGSGPYSGGTGGGGGSAGGYGFAGGGIAGRGAGPVKKTVGDMNLGWQWSRPSLNQNRDKLTEGEKTCEQLLDLLETKNPSPDQVRQRVEALRRAREQQRRELQEARKQLREVVTPEQEAKLILMGYLD